jgi:UDP-N-acetylglucosamine 1-carboxyvinyltransferase
MPLIIEGKHRLQGSVGISGAKNAALPIIAATLLTADECVLENVPYIEDIRNMVRLLHHLGVAARFEGNTRLRVRATRISRSFLPTELAISMRASFLCVGPLLSRFGQATAPHPGGCSIGTRPVSVDLKGFQEMGGTTEFGEESYTIKSRRLRGQTLILDYPSHTGTENLIMAACLAEGTTIIENASLEPEIVDVADFLRAMGARIYGAGTNTVRVDGVTRLHGAAYRIMPDRMEAGTFALAALITGGHIVMPGVVSHWLGALTSRMGQAGAEITARADVLEVRAPAGIKATDIQTYPYPGFPTDLQAPFATTMTQAEGNSSIYETMFDGRLRYAQELNRMGAHIQVSGSGRMAMVHGPTALQGSEVVALDIRSGAAMVLAGLAAEGVTHIRNVAYIERGYEHIEGKLGSLGAVISREAEHDPDCPELPCDAPVEWESPTFSLQ